MVAGSNALLHAQLLASRLEDGRLATCLNYDILCSYIQMRLPALIERVDKAATLAWVLSQATLVFPPSCHHSHLSHPCTRLAFAAPTHADLPCHSSPEQFRNSTLFKARTA